MLGSAEHFCGKPELGVLWGFYGLTKVPFGDYFLFFPGFLSKSKSRDSMFVHVFYFCAREC